MYLYRTRAAMLLSLCLFLLIGGVASKHEITKYGPTVNTTWQGSFTPYYKFDKRGLPMEIGYLFPASVLTNLPIRPSDGKNDIYTCPNGPGTGSVFRYKRGHVFDTSFPVEINGTAFKDGFIAVYPKGVVTLNGTRPESVFYLFFELISRAERDTIPSAYCVQDMCNMTSPIGVYYASMKCEDAYQVAKVLPADETPPTYAQNWNLITGKLGNNLVPVTEQAVTPDPTDGRSLTAFNYRSCYGHICGLNAEFEEEFLLTTLKVAKKFCRDISSPQAYFKAGQYPTQYCYEYDESSDSYRVYITKFAYFRASTGILDPFKKRHPRHPK